MWGGMEKYKKVLSMVSDDQDNDNKYFHANQISQIQFINAMYKNIIMLFIIVLIYGNI